MPTYKKGKKEDFSNCRPVSLTSVPGEFVEIILNATTQHIQDNQGIWPSQYEFMKGSSFLTNQISLCDQMTCLVDEGKAMDVVYLDFDTISVKPLTPFPTAFSWRSWLLMTWTDILLAGSKISDELRGLFQT
ncbi:RNA-directed DNA polymerase from mobile element jockey-like protein [Willisornis vidua]|uniref:RNA-directed DNA polymerase from mobile element jockey-like protein n=1 Tax=Willisornis vidua TaxID=1566151 RepID=A0ABQ9CW64_9PASS|nr:RNA-directed DNA polymerase from mobile element jockey-like protein [Willisornis vidua]